MTLAALLFSAGLTLSPQQADIVQRVVGEGKPECLVYRPDETETPCRPVFSVTAGVHVNAWANGEEIRLSHAAVMRLNREEFALLVAHEVAHYLLGHRASSPAAELAADQLGAQLACRAGYDPAVGLSLLRYLAAGSTHPRRQQRRAVILAVACQRQSATFAR